MPHFFSSTSVILTSVTTLLLCSYSGGSEELSDDITQQQLLPGVKYVRLRPPASRLKLAAHQNLKKISLCLSSPGTPTCGRSSVRCVCVCVTAGPRPSLRLPPRVCSLAQTVVCADRRGASDGHRSDEEVHRLPVHRHGKSSAAAAGDSRDWPEKFLEVFSDNLDTSPVNWLQEKCSLSSVLSSS